MARAGLELTTSWLQSDRVDKLPRPVYLKMEKEPVNLNTHFIKSTNTLIYVRTLVI